MGGGGLCSRCVRGLLIVRSLCDRRCTVRAQNEFVNIGETAILQWGYTDGSPVPGMGWDATAGNIPIGTAITYNLVHEGELRCRLPHDAPPPSFPACSCAVGQWTKQNSFYFQSQASGNVIRGNIAYNGPRAGINFDDGLGGGNLITENVLSNFCRESSDHGVSATPLQVLPARPSHCSLLPSLCVAAAVQLVGPPGVPVPRPRDRPAHGAEGERHDHRELHHRQLRQLHG